jgi:hypothetical protein
MKIGTYNAVAYTLRSQWLYCMPEHAHILLYNTQLVTELWTPPAVRVGYILYLRSTSPFCFIYLFFPSFLPTFPRKPFPIFLVFHPPILLNLFLPLLFPVIVRFSPPSFSFNPRQCQVTYSIGRDGTEAECPSKFLCVPLLFIIPYMQQWTAPPCAISLTTQHIITWYMLNLEYESIVVCWDSTLGWLGGKKIISLAKLVQKRDEGN